MRLSLVALVVVVALAAPALVSPVAAQGSDAVVLYFTSTVVGTIPVAGAKIMLMDETAPAAGKAYAAFGQGQTTYASRFEYTAALPFTIEGSVTVDVKVGCDVAAAFRPGQSGVQATAATTAFRGATSMAGANYFAAPGPTCKAGDTVQIPFTIPLDGQEFAAGEILAFEVLLWWTNPPETVKNGFFYVGAAGSKATVNMVRETAAPPPPAVIYGDLTDATVDLRLPFDVPTTASYHYNWSSPLETGIVNITSDWTQGSATILVSDASGATVHSLAVEGAVTDEMPFLADATANWTIQIEAFAFQGNLSLGIYPEEGPGGDGPGDDLDEGPGDDEGPVEETGNGTGGGKDKGSPGPGAAVLLLIVVAAAAVAVRRKP